MRYLSLILLFSLLVAGFVMAGSSLPRHRVALEKIALPTRLSLHLEVEQIGQQVYVHVSLANDSRFPVTLLDLYDPAWGAYSWFNVWANGVPCRPISIGAYSGRWPPARKSLASNSKVLWGTFFLVSFNRPELRTLATGYMPIVELASGKHRARVSLSRNMAELNGIHEEVAAETTVLVPD